LILFGCAPQTVTIPTPDAGPTSETVAYRPNVDKARGLLCRPASEGPFPAVVLIHDDRGLTDWTKGHAKRLAQFGYVVLAVDLYRGVVVSELEDAHIMDRGLPEDRVLGDLKAAVDFLTERKEVRDGRIGVIGVGMGGGYALDAAIHDPRLCAVVTCYGRLTTDPEMLAPLKASVFAVFAGKDEGIPPETIEQFRVAMDKASKRVAGIKVYSHCPHGFLDPANWPTHGKPSTEDVTNAWDLINNYLEEYLNR
jgi:carboxymethylenebutenolidase